MAKKRKFKSESQELNFLHDGISKLWHVKRNREAALKYSGRLRELLVRRGEDDGSIMLQSHWALLHEVEGNLAQAITSRRREIELIERLFENGGPIGFIDHDYLAQKVQSLADLQRGLNEQAALASPPSGAIID